MNTKDIENRFEKPILELPFYHQLTFIYFLVKRMLPNYETFSSTEKWGNPKILHEAVRVLKQLIIEKKEMSEEEQNLIQKIEEVTPDMENFGSLQATAALDTCVLLLETFGAIPNRNSEIISSLVSLPFNALQMYIEELNDLDYNIKDYDSFVFKHPLIEREIEFQTKLLSLLKNQKEIGGEFFDFFTTNETAQFSRKLSNMGIAA